LYWEHEASLRKSADEKIRIFRRDVAPALGKKVLKEVTRRDLAALVGLEFTSAKTASNRLHSAVLEVDHLYTLRCPDRTHPKPYDFIDHCLALVEPGLASG
jgi:hypothetical protein